MPVPFIKLPEPPKDPLPHFVEESPGWKIGALCVDRAFRLMNLCVWVLGGSGVAYVVARHLWP